ncbi:MAG TPA: hypothetical protein VG122_17135 [Gemmata sp.]|nr:hypothetical protein [Gemmata sp.]
MDVPKYPVTTAGAAQAPVSGFESWLGPLRRFGFDVGARWGWFIV